LHRSIKSIQDMFGESMQPEKEIRVNTLTLEEQLDLARAVNKLQSDRLTKIRGLFDDSCTAGAPKFDDEIDLTHMNFSSQQKINRLLQEARDKVRSEKRRAEPESQLPWVTYEEDSKPKADDVVVNSVQQNDSGNGSRHDFRNFDKEKLEALAPLLDRLGRALIDAAPHVAAVAESIPEKMHDAKCTVDTASDLSTVDTPNRLCPIQEESTPVAPATDEIADMPPLLRRGNSEVSDDSAEVNPDYVDFVNGFIQATRSDAPSRSGGRRGGSSEGSLGSSLFSALLASGNSEGDEDEDSRNSGGRSGPRIVRVGGGGGGISGGGGGGGIDIHIHAIVTGGGGGGIAGIGLDGLAGLGGLLGPPPNAIVLNNSSTSADSRAVNLPVIPTIPSADEEDQGLFSDLYSDNPQPEINNLTGSWNDDVAITDDNNDEDDNVDQEEISPSLTPTNDESGFGDTITRILPTSQPTRDRVYSAPSTPSHSSSLESLTASSRNLENESRTYNDQTDNQRPRSTTESRSEGRSESRRSNSFGRLFRRVLTRRSSSNN